MSKDDNIEILNQQLENKARSMGVLHFGTVDLTSVSSFIVEQGGEWLRQFPFAVTASVPMIDAWVNALSQHDNPRVIKSYSELLEIVDQRWLDIAYELTLILQNSGYGSLPIAEHAVDLNNYYGVFPHKLAAHLAGFGWIGKNTLLITPERGPRLRLLTVLTTAPLGSTNPNVLLNYDGCGDCKLCIDICPANALTGATYTPGIERDTLLDALKCSQYRDRQRELFGARTCALCLHVCPFGHGKTI